MSTRAPILRTGLGVKDGVDPARSLLVGAGPAHRTFAAALGGRYVDLRRA
jgi:hypothetical protein